MIRNRVAWGVRFIVIESFNYKIIGLYREKLLESQFAFRLACLWKMRKMFNSSSFFTSLASHAILVVNCPNGHHRDAKCGLEYSWHPTLAPSAPLCLFVLWQPQPLQVLESSQTVKAITRLLRFHGWSVCLSCDTSECTESDVVDFLPFLSRFPLHFLSLYYSSS